MPRPRAKLARATEKPMPERRTRATDSRAVETRAAEARAMPMPHFDSELYIPAHIVPHGMEYGWIGISVLNEPNPRNWARRSRAGWQPVPRSRHPQQWPILQMPGMHATQHDEVIVNGGLILCERPKSLGNRAREQLRKDRMDALQSVDWTQQGLGDPAFSGAPKTNESSTMIQQVVAERIDDGSGIKA